MKHIIGQNFSNDDVRSYLESNLDLNEGQKKLVFKFWKAHGSRIMRIIEKPVSNQTQGISNMDWEIHLTTSSRHLSGIQKKTATVLI